MASISRMAKSGFLLFSILSVLLTGCGHIPDGPDSVSRPSVSVSVRSPVTAKPDADTSFEVAKSEFIDEFSDKYTFDKTGLTTLFEQVHRNPSELHGSAS